ncbi:MAG TPA: hypothetical protein VHT29_01345 [Solirubrobacteraceae bacterium]|nr:hypothetical protein [Solirubrobacteraceae bacterium]
MQIDQLRDIRVRERAVCEAATHSFLKIDETLAVEEELEIKAPKPGIAERSAVEGFFQQAAEQGAQLRAVARMARGRSVTSDRRRHGLTPRIRKGEWRMWSSAIDPARLRLRRSQKHCATL